MSLSEKYITPYSRAIVRLLKSPVERQSSVWDDVLHYQYEIQEYIGVMGLELIIRKEEGFAFVRQLENSEGATLGLITRHQIGFEASIVLIVLRQSLEDFDSNPTQFQTTEKLITDTEIREELELFLPEGYNRLRFEKDLEKYIGKAAELGYLKVVRTSETETFYKIHRIIKEKITLDDLQEFKIKLQQYVESV